MLFCIQAGFKAGYTAGAKVQVNVDVDLSSRHQRKLPAAPDSNSDVTDGPDDTAEKAVAQSAALVANSTQQSSVADVSTAISRQAAAEASSDGGGGASEDSILRSAAKGLVWRLFSTSATVGIALLVLHDVIQVCTTTWTP